MSSESYAQRVHIMNATAQAVAEHYVYAQRGEALAAHLHAWWKADGQRNAANLDDFVEQLTSVMRSHTADRHLSVRPVQLPPRRSPPPSAAGVRQAAVLDGNIGLIDVVEFGSPADAVAVLDAAMLMISSTAALILDFRQHAGGDSDTEAYFMGYFCREPALINTLS